MLLNSYSYGVHLLRARYSKNCIIRDVESSPACIGSGQTLCHDIYPPRPITTVSLAIEGKRTHLSIMPNTMTQAESMPSSLLLQPNEEIRMYIKKGLKQYK